MGRRDSAWTSEHSERESNSKADGRRYDSSVSDAATTPAATLKITGELGTTGRTPLFASDAPTDIFLSQLAGGPL